jgi:hypothetical protein
MRAGPQTGSFSALSRLGPRVELDARIERSPREAIHLSSGGGFRRDRGTGMPTHVSFGPGLRLCRMRTHQPGSHRKPSSTLIRKEKETV